MTRNTPLLLAASLVVLAGCTKSTDPGPPDPPPGTQVQVVAGMKNQIFEAASPQKLAVLAGVTATPTVDADGHARGLAIAKDNVPGLELSCDCPAGCKPESEPGDEIILGCAVGTDGNIASCSGNCETDTSSCEGCSFSFPQPEVGDPRAAWVKRVDVVRNPDP